MGNLWSDFRYSLRKLIQNAGFSAVVILSLALGIGGSVTIFSLMNAMLFKPLPGIEQPEGLMWVFGSNKMANNFQSSSYADYLDFKKRNDVFTDLAAFDTVTLSLNTGGDSEIVHGEAVTGNYFSVLGVKAGLGRTILPEDDAAGGGSPVTVLSHGFWRRRFASDPAAVGKTVSINGVAFTVIGIAAPEYLGPEIGMNRDLWVPLTMLPQLSARREGPSVLEARDHRRFKIWARLKPGVTEDQAQSAASTVANALEQEHPLTNRKIGARVAPVIGGIEPVDRQDMLPLSGLLMAVVGLVLLIACINIAGLLLTRAASRQREIAIRLSLGARRKDIVQQLVMESLVLFIAGGCLGLLLASWAANLLLTLAPTSVPVVLDSTIDLRVLGFTALLTFITGLVSGLFPALQASRPDLVGSLKSEPATTGGGRRGHHFLRNIFLVAQVGLSTVLLVTAGLFVRSLLNAKNINPGFQVDNALVVPLDLGLQRYTEERGRDFYQRLEQRVQSLPGVTGVSWARFVPLGVAGSGESMITVEGRDPRRDEMPPIVGINTVGPDYFRTMGIPVLSGREFARQDAPAISAAVVNETAVRRYWPEGDPIGKRFRLGGADEAMSEIVGVAKDTKYQSLGEDPQAHVYLSTVHEFESETHLLVRTSGDPRGLSNDLRTLVLEMDRNLVPPQVTTLAEQVAKSLYPARAGAWLMGIFGLLALTLASVGLYGVQSYSVAQRTHEIGIRMALGALPRNVIALVLREGMVLVGIGVAIGLVIALVLTRLLSGFIYGVSTTDPVVFAVIVALLGVVALAASFVPARRGTRVDPVIALRSE
jgi:predicted permease